MLLFLPFLKKSLLKNVSGRKYKKYVEHCKGKVFVCGQYMGAIDFYTVLTYNQFRIINNNCKQYFFIFHVINKILLEVHILS